MGAFIKRKFTKIYSMDRGCGENRDDVVDDTHLSLLCPYKNVVDMNGQIEVEREEVSVD